MKIKIFSVSFAIIILVSIVYYEQHSIPYNNIPLIQNNVDTKTIDLGAYLIKRDENHKQTSSLATNSTKKNQNANNRKAIILPNFPLKIIGKPTKHNIYDIKQERIIIHFWASWCNVCKSEFSSLINSIKNNPKVAIVAISVDDDQTTLGQYLDELEKQYQIKSISNLYISWDHDKSISYDLFGTEVLPENYIIVSKGKNLEVVEKNIGKANWEKLLA